MRFLKDMQRWLLWGTILGSLTGFAAAADQALRHSLIQQGMARLVAYGLAARLMLGILGGLICSALGFLAWKGCRLIWSGFLKSSLKVQFVPSDRFNFFVRWMFLLIFLGYGAFAVLRPDGTATSLSSLLRSGSLRVFGLLILLYAFWNWRSLLKKIPKRWERKAALTSAGITILSLLTAGFLRFTPPSGPSILLVLPDALRSDHLGCYGYGLPVSPNIDEFAAQSVVFENAMSNAPWTKPSVGTLLTSKYPYAHGALNWTDSLDDDNLTLAENLRNLNYSTYGIQTNPALTRQHNFHQGFQRYHQNTMGKADRVVDTFLSWVETRKKPFFAYLHFMDTHVPYNASQAFTEILQRQGITDIDAGQYTTLDVRVLTYLGMGDRDKQDIVDLYDDAIQYFDAHFGRLLQGLARMRKLEDTIVILLADHGEEFWEHGGFAHGQSLYREVIQVPLMIRYPKKLAPRRVTPYVSLKDVYPTVLHLLGENVGRSSSGQSLLPKVFSSRESVSDPIFCEGILYGEEKKGAIWGGWKLIENTGLTYISTLPLLGDMTKYAVKRPDFKYELYDLSTDSNESVNLVTDRPERLSALKNKLSSFSVRHELVSRQTASDLEKKKKDMRTLGYIK
jgi:arylsulfatase A-like enzyme